MKTTTISVRVPLDFKQSIQAICDNKGITLSDYCITKINPSVSVPPINAVALQKLDKGGLTKQTEAFKVPNELSELLGITGGLSIGIIVYNALRDSLQKDNPEWTEDKCVAIAGIAGIASAFLGGYGISQLTKMLQGK
jgi:hypothetical protein